MGKYICIATCLIFLFSCNEELNIPEIKDEAGLLIDISSSNGSLLGEPIEESEENGTVTITEAELNFQINLISGSLDNIKKIEIVKLYSKDKNEIVVTSTSELPFSYNINSIDDLLDTTQLQESDLRIGDYFTFKVKIYKNDGSIFYFDDSHNFILTLNTFLNCSDTFDLSGIYSMTNSLANDPDLDCSLPRLVEISMNNDGTWYAETADGGFLEFCPYDEIYSVANPGNFTVKCGVVIPLESNGVSFCKDYGIGCITGGTWNQEEGILILENTDIFYNYGNYTSTYTRQ